MVSPSRRTKVEPVRASGRNRKAQIVGVDSRRDFSAEAEVIAYKSDDTNRYWTDQMAPRPAPRKQAREPIFGPPATTPEQAFLRFGNALHWVAHFGGEGLPWLVPTPRKEGPDAVLDMALARLVRAEHRLVAEFITTLTSGHVTFAEAVAIWRRSESNTMRSHWEDPTAFLRFLTHIRDRIDPHFQPASRPRFKAG